MKKYWKARAASRLTRYSISQINICQGLFSLAVLFFDTQRTSFWVLGLLFPHHRAHLFPFLCTEYIPFGGVESVFACPMAIRNLLDALFPLYGLPYAQAAAELEMAAAAATVLARFFRRAERECAVKLPRAKSAPPLP